MESEDKWSGEIEGENDCKGKRIKCDGMMSNSDLANNRINGDHCTFPYTLFHEQKSNMPYKQEP